MTCCGEGIIPTLTPTRPDTNTVPIHVTESDYLENEIETKSIENTQEICPPYTKQPCDRPTSWLTTIQEETEAYTADEITDSESTDTTIEIPTSSSTTFKPKTEPSINTESSTYIESTISTRPWISTEPTTFKPITSTQPCTYTEPTISTNPWTYTGPTISTEPWIDWLHWPFTLIDEFDTTTTTTTTSPETIQSTTYTTDKVTEPKTTKTSSTIFPSWLPPLPCNNIRCDRPVTWFTTTKRRRRYNGFRF